MISFDFLVQITLPTEAERELAARHDAEISQLLPVLGLLFGLGVLSFNVWDHLIDPAHAWTTLTVRIWLVLIGSAAYLSSRLPWTPVQRCGYIYCTHAGAIILCEFLLNNGFLYGLTGIAACVFTVSVVTLRIRTFLAILIIPSALFIALSAVRLPLRGFLNGLMLYFFSVNLACIIMLVIRSFRKKAFLLEKKLLQISRRDSLTGAYNRGYLTELGMREIALARRHSPPLAVAMLDIDHFKKVNDTYGHAAGDKVIKSLVNSCMRNLREIDHFGRLGGEEFVCVLPETDEKDAMLCAERLRQDIDALCLDLPQGKIHFTVSIGVAILNQNHGGWEALLKDADTALYSAKRNGRNCVVLASRDGPPVNN